MPLYPLGMVGTLYPPGLNPAIGNEPAPQPVAVGSSLLPPNCTIVFQVPTGTTSTNALGSPTVDTAPLVVVAFLKPKKEYRPNAISDGQQSGQRVAGYMISPKLMPAAIQSEQVGRCVFWRVGMGDGFVLPTSFGTLAELEAFEAANSERVALRGDFFWEANIPGPFGVEAILGDKLAGRMVLRSAWADRG